MGRTGPRDDEHPASHLLTGKVLDTSAILDIAARRSLYGQALVDTALRDGSLLSVPAAALMEAWAGVDPTIAGQAPLVLLRALPVVMVEHLDGETAEAVGAMAAHQSAPASGVAHAVYVARHRGWTIVTRDPDAVIALDPQAAFEPLP